MTPPSSLQREVERMQQAEALSRTGSWDYFPATDTLWVSREAARILDIPWPEEGMLPWDQIGGGNPDWDPFRNAMKSVTDAGHEFNILFSIDSIENSGRVMINAAGILIAGSATDPPHVSGMIKPISSSGTFFSDLPEHVGTIMSTTGIESLDWTCRNISTWLDADCVMIGELQPDGNRVNVLSMILDGKPVKDYTYTLIGTPCDDVAKKGFCLYPEHASVLFPESRDLKELGIQGYLGTSLKNHTGQVMGILCVLSRRPLHPPPVMRHIIELIALKAAAEIERRRAEEDFNKSQQILADAMDLANMASWEFDGARGLFRFDDRFYRIYGTTAEREGGYYMSPETYAREFIPEEERELVAIEMKNAMDSTDSFYLAKREHRIIRRDGEIRDIQVRIGITKDTSGNIIKVHGSNQDITDLKRTELALLQANRKISLLSSITRHDILNQVMALRSYFHMVKIQISDPAILEYLDTMDSVAKDIESQIEFTRVYKDLGTTCQRWFALSDVMPTPPHTIRFQVDLGGLEVTADPLLAKVFYNLLDNSLSHGEHVSEIRVTATERDGIAVILWEDDGIGIPAEEKECIFEKGFGKKSGLGLFLICQILAITGMTIRETGEPGKGARFEITVPKGSYRFSQPA
jgi:PAS domain S-box-containing protein